MRLHLHVLAAGLAMLSAGSAGAVSATTAGPHVDVSSYLRTDAEIEAWYLLRSRLRDDFDAICGDTFCEGDYSNIESLRYQCSVDQVNGRIGRCLWVFAASNEEIDPATGRIVVQPRVWRCPTPLPARTTIEALLGSLTVESPLYAPLPGGNRSIYDGLVDCL
ncbi:hypothetical protein ACFOLC_03835 [Lysobacter cavernae]|uniref:Uncharacterized protein n=1 Tax=Lysobacter cavernae TaxID=1685901 RepID=A0ABV7RPL6_9GAMM